MSGHLLTDRTSIETDWTCGMKYWWYKCSGGKGIVPVTEASYFKEGRDIHELLHHLAEAEDPLGYVRDQWAIHQASDEITHRLYGWAFAWAMFIEPKIRDTYETLHLEQELVLERDPLWLVTTPDRVLRSKEQATVVVDDYKSTSGSMGWADHWPYAVQVHIQLKAVEEELGIKPSFGRIRGLSKGQRRDGRLVHPYVHAWVRGDEWTHEYRSGLVSTPVWEYPDGLEAWVRKCGEDVARGQFPLSQPIFLNERLLNDMITRRIEREKEIAAYKDVCQVDESLRSQIFEQRFSQCRPIGQKGACPYLAACHSRTVNLDPLASGLYAPRTPHHELEIIGVDDAE